MLLCFFFIFAEIESRKCKISNGEVQWSEEPAYCISQSGSPPSWKNACGFVDTSRSHVFTESILTPGSRQETHVARMKKWKHLAAVNTNYRCTVDSGGEAGVFLRWPYRVCACVCVREAADWPAHPAFSNLPGTEASCHCSLQHTHTQKDPHVYGHTCTPMCAHTHQSPSNTHGLPAHDRPLHSLSHTHTHRDARMRVACTRR